MWYYFLLVCKLEFLNLKNTHHKNYDKQIIAYMNNKLFQWDFVENNIYARYILIINTKQDDSCGLHFVVRSINDRNICLILQ